MSRAIDKRSPSRESPERTARSLGTSYRSQYAQQSIASIAEESLDRDLEDEELRPAIEPPEDLENNTLSRTSTQEPLGEHSLAGNHRRPSYAATGPKPFLGLQQPETIIPLEQDREAAIAEERTLLRDNNIIPPKQPRRGSQASSTSSKGIRHRLSNSGFSRPRRKNDEESATGIADAIEPTETTALLTNSQPTDPEAPNDDDATPETIDKQWNEAVLAGQIHTTWQREAQTIFSFGWPLMFTFLLQQSLTLTSIFTVGHIGKFEIGAVSLGGMTASITGYAVYHGLATSLDTLCAQAYGSGKKKLVGLNLQRMVFFLWTCTIPIAAIWLSAKQILMTIVPEKEIAELAGLYLKILILGAPAYACFESSKRYVQAQGDFRATLYVLLIAAPTNVFLHWLFVWQFNWGFIGCPIAIVITENLMPLLLFLYIRFLKKDGMDCWPGFSRKAWVNWGPMIRLALPGFAMVIAEFMAFEILTLASARISASHLAANTVLMSMSVAMYCLPFPVSIAGSTRLANLVGASLPEAAKVTARVMFVFGVGIGLFNMLFLSSLRGYIPYLFTQDPEVIALASATLPINAAFQLFDALAAQCNGILRGLGRQSIGGIITIVAFYGIAVPFSFGTAFGLDWKLYGLWAGPAIGLFVQSLSEGTFIYMTSFEKASVEAAKRNAAG